MCLTGVNQIFHQYLSLVNYVFSLVYLNDLKQFTLQIRDKPDTTARSVVTVQLSRHCRLVCLATDP